MPPATAGSATRCRRCGTLMRNNRAVCPSCGTEVSASEPAAQAAPAAAAAAPAASAASAATAQAETAPSPTASAPKSSRRAVQAKAGMTMCPMCMSSVPADSLVEFSGQKICQNCHTTMSKKSAAKPPQEPPKQ